LLLLLLRVLRTNTGSDPMNACTAGAIANPEYLSSVAENGTMLLRDNGAVPPEKWLLPKIHNSPACLSGRKPGFPLH